MKELVCVLYDLGLILIVCYMCTHYSNWWLFLLLFIMTTEESKDD
mgnify:CR=1 FL=1